LIFVPGIIKFRPDYCKNHLKSTINA